MDFLQSSVLVQSIISRPEDGSLRHDRSVWLQAHFVRLVKKCTQSRTSMGDITIDLSIDQFLSTVLCVVRPYILVVIVVVIGFSRGRSSSASVTVGALKRRSSRLKGCRSGLLKFNFFLLVRPARIYTLGTLCFLGHQARSKLCADSRFKPQGRPRRVLDISLSNCVSPYSQLENWRNGAKGYTRCGFLHSMREVQQLLIYF